VRKTFLTLDIGKLTLFRLDLSDSYVVYVGSKKKKYTIHKDYTTSSGFFRAATNGNWEEADTKEIQLPDHKPAAFDTYSNWLYTGKIVLDCEDSISTASNRLEKGRMSTTAWAELLGAYILAHYLLDIAFQNALLDDILRVQQMLKFYPGTKEIRTIW
jgi:hypothetical protein